MPIVALLVAFLAIGVFAYDFHKNKGIVSLGLTLFTVAFVLNSWTVWHNVHWLW